MYADDGLYYGDLENEPITQNTNMVKRGLYFNLAKSGWVKRDGKWLRPLKFLGLEYDAVQDELRARTRKGSALVFDKWELLEALDALIYEGNDSPRRRKPKQDKWNNLVISKWFGFMQSKLYVGAWNKELFDQDFALTYSPNSYIDNYRGKLPVKITVFNSTSFAAEHLCQALRRRGFERRVKVKVK